jgi:triosephosphate isomerase
VETGGQNCFWESKGAFTGETSPRALYSWGARYVILGHSERKRYFGENPKMIAKKLQAALKENLIPIVCVGESAQEKEEGKTFEVISEQLEEYLGGIEAIRVRRVIFCYEPIWAISANGPAILPTQNDIMSARLVIQKFLSKTYGSRLAEQVLIIYGGSVDSQNAEETCLKSGMDGALVGSASLKPMELVKIGQVLETK